MSDFQLDDRAQIEADLLHQGLAEEVSYEDVAATFNLYRKMQPPSLDGPPPSPAMGPDARYAPEPGEEGLFADTSDMWYPPTTG
jgi:hypothetical protein